MNSNLQGIVNQLNSQVVNGRINAFFNHFSIARLAYRCGMRKARGVPVLSVLLTVFTLPFAHSNIYRHFKEESTPFQKDALYALLRSSSISWRRFLMQVALQAMAFLLSLSEKG